MKKRKIPKIEKLKAQIKQPFQSYFQKRKTFKHEIRGDYFTFSNCSFLNFSFLNFLID